MAKGKLISYLGVDIGSASIKIVELDDYNGTPRLVTYGFIDDVPDIKNIDKKETQEKIAKIINKICDKSKTQSKRAITALPNYSVFNSIIKIQSGLKKDELALEIKSQARKVFPLELEEMYLDWKFLPGEEQKFKAKKEFAKILITGASKSLVKNYIDLVKMAGLSLVSLETESFALARSLVGKDSANIMIVDLGNATTEISIISKGTPVFNRSIEIGGINFTNILSNTLGMDFQTAERLKKDTGITKEEVNGKMEFAQVNKKLFGPIINEINYSFRTFQEENQGEQVEKIILCGGGANIKNIVEYFESTFNKRVFIGDPWSQIIYPAEMRPILRELAPRYAVSLGLAMREIV